AVIYECLTGNLALPERRRARIDDAPPKPASKVNPDVPRELNDIVVKLLADLPAQRYQSADDLLRDLQALDLKTRETEPLAASAATTSSVGSPTKVSSFISSIVTRPRYSIPTVVLVLVAALFAYRGFTSTKPPRVNWYEKGVEALRNGAYQQAS